MVADTTTCWKPLFLSLMQRCNREKRTFNDKKRSKAERRGKLDVKLVFHRYQRCNIVGLPEIEKMRFIIKFLTNKKSIKIFPFLCYWSKNNEGQLVVEFLMNFVYFDAQWCLSKLVMPFQINPWQKIMNLFQLEKIKINTFVTVLNV